MPATPTYSPVFPIPATARTQLAPTCRYARYTELPPPPFRHTPNRPWPWPTATVWRNLGQHPHRDGTYTFSAKEKDAETGLSYFGSRYYNSDLSIWLSVDPMSDKYPSLSPYVYCADNPVKLVDPNGEEIGWVVKADGTIDWDKNAHNQKTTKKGETYLGEEGQRSVGTTVLNYHNDGTISEQKTVLIMDWGEDPATYVSTSRTFKEWEADVTNKSVGFFQGFSIFLMSPINDAIVLTTHHDFYGYPVTKEDKIWSAAGLFTFGTSKTLKALRLFDKVKKTKKIEHGVEAVGTGLDIKTGRETYKKNKRRGANEKK